MFYTYVLKSKKDRKLYIGCTDNLRRRFTEHQNGLSPATRYREPWVLIYYEAYLEKSDAQKRERQLKKFSTAYGELKKRIVASNED
ncbi:MAG: GIY-YIG nuclease family protein [Patescibacteria group bacterium]